MYAIERDSSLKAVGYEALVWVNDEQGREFSCALDSQRGNVSRLDQLTEQEKKSCMDVNVLVGTERW